MENEMNSVDGMPQEEAAKKTVTKPRTKKTAAKPASEANATLSKSKRPQRRPTKKATPGTSTAPEAPTTPPTEAPTAAPTEAPTTSLTEAPTAAPTEVPSAAPTETLAPIPPVPVPTASAEGSTPAPAPKPERKPQPIPPLPNIVINDIVELANAPKAAICLSDQQIQQLTLAEAIQRYEYLEYTLANILDYDVVLSDTNIWIELLVGHTSSHSDPRVNARLQFERQLEFISRLIKHRGGRFMMMAETYEEIDRFATQQEPTNYRDADWTDESLCRNVAARLAKRLILSQQRENRLRIEGIGAESHHASFADPIIIRRTVEMFAQGKKVLLLTNDASVAIRSMGMCDDLQRHNNIDDRTWDEVYAPLRPMVITMDDLKLLDNYTRQYHFLQVAAGKQWMEDIPMLPVSRDAKQISPVYGGVPSPRRHNLTLWEEGFRPGDRRDRNAEQQRQQQKEQQRQKELERQKEQERQKEAERQKELQRQQQRERDRQRQQELNRQKEIERQKELERQEQQRQQEQQQQEQSPQQPHPQEQLPQQPQEPQAPAPQPVAPVPAASAEGIETPDTTPEQPKKKLARRSSRSRSPRRPAAPKQQQ